MARPPQLTRVTLGVAVDTYLDTCQARVDLGDLSPATLRNYRADLLELVDILGEHVIADDVEGTDLDRALRIYAQRPDRRYKNTRDTRGTGGTADGAARAASGAQTKRPRPGRSAGTLRRFHQSVSRFFTNAVTRGFVQASPVTYAQIKPPGKTRPGLARRSLTLDMAKALLEHGPGDPDPAHHSTPGTAARERRPHEQNYWRDRALLWLILAVAPRVSEVCQADEADFTLRGPSPEWLVHGKGGKDRDVPLPPAVVDVIGDYLEHRPEPTAGLFARVADAAERRRRVADAQRAMFRTGHGGRLSPRDVQRLLQRAVQRANQAQSADTVRDVTPHGLRHTSATVLLADGWDVKIVKQLLGHENIATTSAYVDELPGELHAAMRAHVLRPPPPERSS